MNPKRATRPGISGETTTDSSATRVPNARMSSTTVSWATAMVSTATPARAGLGAAWASVTGRSERLRANTPAPSATAIASPVITESLRIAMNDESPRRRSGSNAAGPAPL